LVDIEKMIKHKFVPAELIGFVPTRSADRGSERRPAARGQQERGPRREESAGSPPRAPTSAPAPAERSAGAASNGSRSSYASPRKEKVDPFFSQPYEPSVSTHNESAPVDKVPAKPKQKMAALLGGAPKR
jgi:hypothetical protein